MTKTIEKMEGLIYLEDGTVFKGRGFGFKGTAVGELVFNTSMTGYQKILTDPSYKGQIINMTYPLIGNYGISRIDNESDKIHAFGLVIKDLCDTPSNSNSVMTMDQWLQEQKIPGVFGVDSRQITKKIRTEGTVKCLISTEGISIAKARELCRQGELRGDWMKEVSTEKKYVLEPMTLKVGEPQMAKECPEAGENRNSGGSLNSDGKSPDKEKPLHVAVLDFGVKANILSCLRQRNCRLTVYPYGTPAEEILAEKPDGIFLTNGPGDPEEATEAIQEVQKLIRMSETPMFGICMGHQILAIALGGKTYKLKYGHRGGNHGVFDKDTKRSYITSQNHGFAVQHESIILKGMEVTHLNLNDGTVEGMEHRDFPIFSVQFHPEASPGPNDNDYLFDKFIRMMKEDGSNA
ncbi:MAG: glutamine-hydrolyzing carbamoyl-phosphate synthase small subunit [Bacillota bacterium]|nr:glutamine-hydrolyzing carbamoyl-phosphate synthase small subunit [Bacillota bacterium]